MKTFLRIFIAIVLLGSVFAAYFWFGVFNKTIKLPKANNYFYIPSNSDFKEVIKALNDQGLVSENFWFTELAKLRHLPNNIYPGRYTLPQSITYNDLIIKLRKGEIDEVKVNFHLVKNIQQLCTQVAKQIEATEEELYALLSNASVMHQLGFNANTFISLFIPNTYYFYWNTSAEQFLKRMQEEYKRFWNEERKVLAHNLGLTQSQVSTLASIVQAEQNRIEDEWPIIAGLYLNRIRKGMKLQSDPTAIYAVGDFSIKRVLFEHLQYDSPYNTYKYFGLPPGPILIPSGKAIEAVLNYQKHNYIYMCAKPGSGGRHAFTDSYLQHQRNAQIWRTHINNQKKK